MCDSVIGKPCPQCSGYLFPGEDFCPKCGTSAGEYPGKPLKESDGWSKREYELLEKDLQVVAVKPAMKPAKTTLDQDDIDELFQ